MPDIVFPFTADFTFSPEKPHYGDSVTYRNECRNMVCCSCWKDTSPGFELQCRNEYAEHGDVTQLKCYAGGEEVCSPDKCGGRPYDWISWDFGDGTRLGFPGEGSPCYPNDPNVPRPDTPTHVYQQPGTYTVSVIMWVKYNYTKPDSGWGGYPTYVYPTQEVLRLYAETGKSYTVTVAGDPPGVGFTATPREGVVPLTVQFTDQSTNDPTAWLWQFGDGTTSDVQHPTHTYEYPGLYPVALTAANTSGQASEVKEGYILVLPQVNQFKGIFPNAKPATFYGRYGVRQL